MIILGPKPLNMFFVTTVMVRLYLLLLASLDPGTCFVTDFEVATEASAEGGDEVIGFDNIMEFLSSEDDYGYDYGSISPSTGDCTCDSAAGTLSRCKKKLLNLFKKTLCKGP
jgi:hypothetical protein